MRTKASQYIHSKRVPRPLFSLSASDVPLSASTLRADLLSGADALAFFTLSRQKTQFFFSLFLCHSDYVTNIFFLPQPVAFANKLCRYTLAKRHVSIYIIKHFEIEANYLLPSLSLSRDLYSESRFLVLLIVAENF